MNIFSILPAVLKTVGSVLGLNVVKDAGAALAAAQLSPEKAAELQEALLVHEQAMAQISLDELKTVISESVAEIQSPDKYVARARPTGLYILYGVSGAIAIGMLLGVKLDPTAVLTVLAPLAGVGGTYVYQRSQEKIAQMGGNGK